MFNLLASSPSPSTFVPESGDNITVVAILTAAAFVIIVFAMIQSTLRRRRRNKPSGEKPERRIYGRDK